jgi:hypothetical protein
MKVCCASSLCSGGRDRKGQAVRCNSSLVPHCGIFAAILHAVCLAVEDYVELLKQLVVESFNRLFV